MLQLKTKGITEPVTLKNLPTIRQAFVVASGIIVAGYIFEYLVDPLFGFVPLLVAGGLLLAGLSGFCPMVFFLQKLQGKK